MAIELLVAIVLVLANGFFVAAEFAIARLRPTQIAEYARERRPGAKSALHAVTHIDSYLAACQLGITLSSLGLGAVGEPAFHHALEPLFGDATRVVGIGIGSAVAFSIITILHVVLGELAPKSLAISRTAPVALALAPVLRGFYLLTKPLVDLFNGMGNLLLKPFGIPPASEAGHAPHSEEELRTLLRESRAGGLIERHEAELSERALVFGDRRVREVMRPRPEIVYVTTADDARRVAEVATASGHTRLPLVEPDGGLDAPVGVINVKDLLPAFVHGREIDLRAIARPLARVPESALVDEVLRELRRGRKHIALVVDEHGTTVGLVTLEDILEEIVGEIEDEFDSVSAVQVRRADGVLHIDGGAPVREVAEELGLDLDEAPHEATIGGHLLEQLGRVPEEGEIVDLHGVPVQVTRVGEAQVAELRVPPQAS